MPIWERKVNISESETWPGETRLAGRIALAVCKPRKRDARRSIGVWRAAVFHFATPECCILDSEFCFVVIRFGNIAAGSALLVD